MTEYHYESQARCPHCKTADFEHTEYPDGANEDEAVTEFTCEYCEQKYEVLTRVRITYASYIRPDIA